MKWRCPHCEAVFESNTPPRSCPLCSGGATARKRFPSKRKTHKQIRAEVRARNQPPEGHIHGEVTIKL